MRLKKLGAALVVVTALGAVLASSAFAAATTTDVSWYIGNAPGTTIGGSKALKSHLSSTTETFFSTVSGQEVVLEAKKTTCLNCTIGDVSAVAIVHLRLVFEDVTVEKPANCTTSSSITTNALVGQPDWMIGSTNYIKLVPEAGEEKGFATISLSGEACPISTSIIPKGSLFVQSVNATGTQAVSQEVNSSKAINETAGGSLHVGTEAAWLEGSTAFELSGESEGMAFGTH